MLKQKHKEDKLVKGEAKELLRLGGIIFCLLGIFICGLYSYRYGQKHFFSFSDHLKNPEVIAGRAIVLSYRKVTAVGPGFFKVKEGEIEVRVEGDAPGIKVGDSVTVKGIFDKEGYISLRDYYLSHHRNLKIIASCLAVILSFLYLLFHFRFNLKNFTFVERT